MGHDTIVIGAGLSGLAAGIRLAQFDRRVVVLERHSLWGGLNSFYTLEGRRFDVGLHALTNFVPRGARGTPLTRILRQLRLSREELHLGEQRFSEILLPGLRLSFTNDFAHLEEEVARAFPSERDGFASLAAEIRGHDLGRGPARRQSARVILRRFLREPLLVEALMVPTSYYGSAREDELDWRTFAILFRSIFLEGLCRPEGGVRPLLNLLVKRYRSVGGELRLMSGVRRILVENGRARGVLLESGEKLEADQILSSAGLVETLALCGRRPPEASVGRISFIESISVLDRTPAELGHGAATSFFSTRERLRYRVPEEEIDVASGVISVPNNFRSERPLPEGIVRLTTLASFERWKALSPEEYSAAKVRLADRAIESAARFTFDWRPNTIFRDVFTPLTIRRFTGHMNGAVYGSPDKRPDGDTGIEGLHLCGSDQGFVGVIGAMMSGITIANRYALVRT